MKMTKSDILWISWQNHQRTTSICDHFKIKCVIFSSKKSRIIKHPIFIWKTYDTIKKNMPKVLIVQNPSLFLTILACILKKYFSFFLIVDAHNVALYPENFIIKRIKYINNFIFKTSDLILVTNERLKKYVVKENGKAFVLPDKIPNFIAQKDKTKNDTPKIVYICTFSRDEPFLNFFKSCSMQSAKYDVYCTGNINKLDQKIYKKYKNCINFTGYLSEEEYISLLLSADLIIDLTYREDCLVCGAYEGVAAEVPLILSDTHALRYYFSSGVVFTKNDPFSIVNSINYAMNNSKKLKEEIYILKKKLSISWHKESLDFLKIINNFLEKT